MPRVLGVSFHYHDAAAALVVDDRIVAAADEERFSRKKHDAGVPEAAIAFCLARGKIHVRDLDAVVFYEKPVRKFHRILATSLVEWPRACGFYRRAVSSWLSEKLWVKDVLARRLGIDPAKILFLEHHLSHAASAFLASPYESSAVMTVDGVGEWATTTLGRAATSADGTTSIHLTLGNDFPHSLGLLYSAFTAWLGFEVNEGEYKVMGMAPYGKPRHIEKIHQVARLSDDGHLHLNLDYFSHHWHPEETTTKKFRDLFGPPRSRAPQDLAVPEEYAADVASSIQAFTEEALLRMARKVYADTGEKRLVMAGGVALNSCANYRILRETPFEEIYVQPAAGDSGGALGAALYGAHVLLGGPRPKPMMSAGLGAEYDAGRIRRELDGLGVKYEWVEDESKRADFVVESITSGGVVGWMNGRFEYGPRALGHRSILADPRRAEMKETVNRKIKFREPFRPFAPSVLLDEVPKHFDLPEPARHLPARFMLYVAPVTSDKIPAVTHVDGTGRLQVVTEDANPSYHHLISRFREATGLGVVLNTSFNLKGEPIVNTPSDAVSTYQRCEMDRLVIGPACIGKR